VLALPFSQREMSIEPGPIIQGLASDWVVIPAIATDCNGPVIPVDGNRLSLCLKGLRRLD
jgi:hypothetical protein